MEGTRKTGDAQAALDIVAATPVLDRRLSRRREIRMTGGKGDGIGVGNQLGPTRKTRLAGHQPLGVGEPVIGARQAHRAQLRPGLVRFVVVQGFEKTLRAFTQCRQVEQTVLTGRIDGRHANSLQGSVRRQAGSWNE